MFLCNFLYIFPCTGLIRHHIHHSSLNLFYLKDQSIRTKSFTIFWIHKYSIYFVLDLYWIHNTVIYFFSNFFFFFCGMVDQWKAFNLISSQDHCQRSSPLRISDTPWAGFEPAQNLSSGLVEWSCAVAITTTQWIYRLVQWIYNSKNFI